MTLTEEQIAELKRISRKLYRQVLGEIRDSRSWTYGPISPQSAFGGAYGIPPPPAAPAECPHELVGETEIVEAMIECRSESVQVTLERLRKKGFDLIRRKP